MGLAAQIIEDQAYEVCVAGFCLRAQERVLVKPEVGHVRRSLLMVLGPISCVNREVWGGHVCLSIRTEATVHFVKEIDNWRINSMENISSL